MSTSNFTFNHVTVSDAIYLIPPSTKLGRCDMIIVVYFLSSNYRQFSAFAAIKGSSTLYIPSTQYTLSNPFDVVVKNC